MRRGASTTKLTVQLPIQIVWARLDLSATAITLDVRVRAGRAAAWFPHEPQGSYVKIANPLIL